MTDQETQIVIAVPTALELERIQGHSKHLASYQFKKIGFGPVAAAVNTSKLIAENPGMRLILVGIAGSYSEQVAIGSAYQFESVAMYGIGAGAGKQFVSSQEMGFSQLEGIVLGNSESIELQLIEGLPTAKQLLTVCASADCPADVQQRNECYPAACAEDMEGFGVALACAANEKPLTIVRGISNFAGNRDVGVWKIDEAIESVCRQLENIVSSGSRL